MMDMRFLIDAQDESHALSSGWVLHPDKVAEEEPLILETVEMPKRRGRPPKIRMEDEAG